MSCFGEFRGETGPLMSTPQSYIFPMWIFIAVKRYQWSQCYNATTSHD